ncbi:UNVERIFIED_CONTAM: hypothetical protein RMT77_003901 [Armadillidium vulgare]
MSFPMAQNLQSHLSRDHPSSIYIRLNKRIDSLKKDALNLLELTQKFEKKFEDLIREKLRPPLKEAEIFVKQDFMKKSK